jgi:hypothetical protein
MPALWSSKTGELFRRTMVDTEALQDRSTRFSKQNLLNGSCNRVFEITAVPFSSSICYQSISLNPTKSLVSEQVVATKKELLFPSTGEFSSAEQSGALFSSLSYTKTVVQQLAPRHRRSARRELSCENPRLSQRRNMC